MKKLKLSFNKEIIANLDKSALGSINGGVLLTKGCPMVTIDNQCWLEPEPEPLTNEVSWECVPDSHQPGCSKGVDCTVSKMNSVCKCD